MPTHRKVTDIKEVRGWTEKDHEVILFPTPQKAIEEFNRLKNLSSEYAFVWGPLLVKSIGADRLSNIGPPKGYLEEVTEWAKVLKKSVGKLMVLKPSAQDFPIKDYFSSGKVPEGWRIKKVNLKKRTNLMSKGKKTIHIRNPRPKTAV